MFHDDGENTGPVPPVTGDNPAPTAGADVIRMADFDLIRPSQILMEMRAYWESLRKGRAIPDRADVEPRGIRSGLDYAFILERIAPGAARFRLAGRHLIDLMGMEVRGMPLCSLINPTFRGRLSDVLESVFKAPQIAEMRLSAEGGYARPALNARMLIMPLKSDLGDISRALGCFVSEGEIGRGPRRFDLLSDEISPVIPGALILEPSPSAAGFTEPAAPWKPAAMPPRPRVVEAESPEERRARFKIITDNS